MLSFGAEDQSTESKGAYKLGHDESTSKYCNLKFDSFQQSNQPSFIKPIHQLKASDRRSELEKESVEEETRKDDNKGHQSTSGPKDIEVVISHEEEEDLEHIIIQASERAAAMKLGMDGILSGGSSYQQSVHSNKDSAGGASSLNQKLIPSAPELVEKHKGSASVELGKELKNDMVVYYSKLLERVAHPSQGGQDYHFTNKSSLNTLRYLDAALQTANLDERDLTSNENKLTHNNNECESSFDRSDRVKVFLKKKKKPERKPSRKNSNKKEKSAVFKIRKDEVFPKVSRLEGITPRNSSGRKKISTSRVHTLKLDLSNLIKSPKKCTEIDRTGVSQGLNQRPSSKLATTKSSIIFERSSKPGKDGSANMKSLCRSSMIQGLESIKRTGTPLSKKELKRFMDKRKLTETNQNINEFSSNVHCKSAIRLKAKRKSNPQLLFLDDNLSVNKKQDKKENLELVFPQYLTTDLRNSRNSNISGIIRDKSQGRILLRTSGESKMGEKEKARIRDMGDRHLEVTKALTSRAKLNTLELGGDSSSNFRDQTNDMTPERAKTSRKSRDIKMEEEVELPFFFKKSQAKIKMNLFETGGEESFKKMRSIKIDIGNLSSKILSTMQFEN